MNPQTTVTFSQLITPYLPLVTPPTLLILAWRARGFFDRLVNNHLAHFK